MRINFFWVFVINIFVLSFCDKIQEQNKTLKTEEHHNSTGKTVILPSGWKVNYGYVGSNETNDEKSDEEFRNEFDLKSDDNTNTMESIDEEFKDNFGEHLPEEQNKLSFDSMDKEFDDNFKVSDNSDDNFESIDQEFKELDKNDPKLEDKDQTIKDNKPDEKHDNSTEKDTVINLSLFDNHKEDAPGILIQTDPDFDSEAHYEDRLIKNDRFLDGLHVNWDFTRANAIDHKPGKKYDDFYTKYDQPLDQQQKEFLLILNKLKELDHNMKNMEVKNNGKDSFSIVINHPEKGVDINLGDNFRFNMNFNNSKNDLKNEISDEDFKFKDISVDSLDNSFDNDFEEFSEDMSDIKIDNFDHQLPDDNKINIESIGEEFNDNFDDHSLEGQNILPIDLMDKEFKDVFDDHLLKEQKMSPIISFDKELKDNFEDHFLEDQKISSIDSMDEEFKHKFIHQLFNDNEKTMESMDKEFENIVKDIDIDISKDNNLEEKNVVIKRPGIDLKMKYAMPKEWKDLMNRPITRTHIIRTHVKPEKNKTDAGNAPKTVSEDIEIYEYLNPGVGPTIPVVVKGFEKRYSWFDYTWVALVVAIYFLVVLVLYIKCMRSSKCGGDCAGGCGNCGECRECSDCCDEEEGKGLINEKGSHQKITMRKEAGWLESLGKIRLTKLKFTKNRRLNNIERLRQFLNE